MRIRNQQKLTTAFLMTLFLFTLTTCLYGQNMFRKVNDFDGDGKADCAVTRNENGYKYWWIWQSRDGLKVVQFGLDSDSSAASDYDGDGKTDIAVWRVQPSIFNATYYILESQTNNFTYKSFFYSIAGSMMHQDYNGDGKTDAAVQQGHGPTFLTVNYGGSNAATTETINAGFGVRTGDLSGDGRADLTLQMDSATYSIRDSSTNATRTLQFGLNNDKFVIGDYDGDGKGEFAIWRPSDGTWWWLRSSDGSIGVVQWGTNGDTPVPADYDGDGKTDIAIYRPGAPGVYWIYGSQNGSLAVAWGTSNDGVVTY